MGIAVTLVGVALICGLTGGRSWEIDLDLAYGLGALVISIPWIVIVERWRRRTL